MIEKAYMLTLKRYERLLKAYEEMEESYEIVRKALIGPNLKLDPDYIAEENKEYWDEQNAKSPEQRRKEFEEWKRALGIRESYIFPIQ